MWISRTLNSLKALPDSEQVYMHTLADALLFAAKALEADEGPAHQAEGRVLGPLGAGGAGLAVVVLEDGVVVLRQLQQAGRRPARILRHQSLGGVGGTGSVQSDYRA